MLQFKFPRRKADHGVCGAVFFINHCLISGFLFLKNLMDDWIFSRAAFLQLAPAPASGWAAKNSSTSASLCLLSGYQVWSWQHHLYLYHCESLVSIHPVISLLLNPQNFLNRFLQTSLHRVLGRHFCQFSYCIRLTPQH